MVQLRKVTQFQAATLTRPDEKGSAAGKESAVSSVKSATPKASNTDASTTTTTTTTKSTKSLSSGSSAKNNLVHINHCHLCSQLLPDQEAVIRYKAASFHVRCFKCTVCGGSMRNRKVYEDVVNSSSSSTSNSTPQSNPAASSFRLFCERCYLARLDRCTACGRLIEHGRIVLLGETTKLHQSCFTCAGCQAPLEAYVEDEQVVATPPSPPKPKVRPPFSAVAPKPTPPPPTTTVRRYCQPCYLAHCLPACAACASKLRLNPADGTMEQLVGPDGRLYHPACFRCDGCDGSLDVPAADGGAAGGGSAAPSISPANAGGGAVNKEFFPVAGRKLCRACAALAEAKEAAVAAAQADGAKGSSPAAP